MSIAARPLAVGELTRSHLGVPLLLDSELAGGVRSFVPCHLYALTNGGTRVWITFDAETREEFRIPLSGMCVEAWHLYWPEYPVEEQAARAPGKRRKL